MHICNMNFMEKKFYTSTEAAAITGCTRRQLQYWREKGVVVPSVNTTGKGRNVYYSVSDLVALSTMQYLLSVGLNFEVAHKTLEALKEREPLFFGNQLNQSQKRFMVLPSPGQNLELAEFSKQKAMKAITNGQPVIPFFSDRVHDQLEESLNAYQLSLSKE